VDLSHLSDTASTSRYSSSALSIISRQKPFSFPGFHLSPLLFRPFTLVSLPLYLIEFNYFKIKLTINSSFHEK